MHNETEGAPRVEIEVPQRGNVELGLGLGLRLGCTEREGWGALTTRGTRRSLLVPWPSWEQSPAPQVKTSRVEPSAMVCRSPHSTCRMRRPIISCRERKTVVRWEAAEVEVRWGCK